MSDKYKRPIGQHQSEIVVINSRFITTVNRADTPELARKFVQAIRSEMPNASHHVYAFRAGYGNSVTEGMSDDGEPSGTAGPPTLSILRGSDIGDIVLVTTRYFGGTKLGTGGLVRAYTESAKTALASLETEIKAAKVQLGMDVAYTHYEPVKHLISNFDAAIDDEIFAGDVSLIVTFLEEDVESFEVELTNLTAGQVEPILLARLDD
ncbi:MAG: YigZ family protein [Anaerolineae bacterium]|nr:YigZ family protein [Anaerolineae bacterium]